MCFRLSSIYFVLWVPVKWLSLYAVKKIVKYVSSSSFPTSWLNGIWLVLSTRSATVILPNRFYLLFSQTQVNECYLIVIIFSLLHVSVIRLSFCFFIFSISLFWQTVNKKIFFLIRYSYNSPQELGPYLNNYSLYWSISKQNTITMEHDLYQNNYKRI